MRDIVLDVTRLFVRGSRFSPTGVDRVVMAYGRWLHARDDINLRPVLSVGGRVFEIPRATLGRMLAGAAAFAAEARSEAFVSATWARLLHALEAEAGNGPLLRALPISHQASARAKWHLDLFLRSVAAIRPMGACRPGTTYLNVSHTGLDHPALLRGLALAGARCVVMVHDLIPITHPEYCAPRAEGRHLRRMNQVLSHVDQVITNSKSTADNFEAYASDIGRAAPPVTVAPLGIEPDFLSTPEPITARDPYFICVGTIEARKNLAFLLAVWRRLAERLGSRTPRLVVVGRRGWENESVLDHLQRSKSVVKWVHEVSDLQDAELARLMAGALALLGPSFAEGFDLPVLEALALGTPVIASDIAAHRELATGATLLDPLDGPAWLSAVESALATPRRGAPYAAPTWPAHFATVDLLV